MEERRQRDFLVELEDAKRVDSVELQSILNKLPAREELTVGDIVTATGSLSAPTVYGLIESGQLKARNIGTKKDGRPCYRIPRVSFIMYYKKSFV